MFRFIVIAFATILGLIPAGAEERDCGSEKTVDRFQDLSSEGDLILASGKHVRILGVRLPSQGPADGLLKAWLQTRKDQSVQVQELGRPDRWGNIPVSIFSVDGQEWSREWVKTGLVLVDLQPDEHFCPPDLTILEAQARNQHLGLWKQDDYTPLNAAQPDQLKTRIGQFVLVEGKIRSVGERRQRTYLNFGEKWSEDFTIIISKPAWQRMIGSGLSASTLKGRWIRARGVLEDWQGTALRVENPLLIELIKASED